MTVRNTKKIPRISGLNLMRYALQLIRKPLPTLEKLVRKYGNIIEFNGGKHQQLFFISDAKTVKHILKTDKTNFLRSPVIKALKPLLGDGIFISEGNSWKNQNTQLRPAFHDAQIQRYKAIVDQEVRSLSARWANHSAPFEIESDIERTMLRILIKTQFSEHIHLDHDAIIAAHGLALEETSIKTQKIDFFRNKFLKPLGVKSKPKPVSPSVQYLVDTADRIIAEGKKDPENCGFILGEMIRAKCSHEEIRDMVLNIIFAGYDTTASALSWSIFALAQNPSEQQMIRDEIGSEDISFVDLSRHAYTKMALQEAMRIYPPVWSIHRQSKQASSIGDYPYPDKAYFMICPYTMHRDPNFWEHPDEFYPKHFLPESVRGKAFQYIPFGQGERVCIGKPLAMMELQVIVEKLIQQFHFSTVVKNQPEITPGIIIKSKNGLRVSVRKTEI